MSDSVYRDGKLKCPICKKDELRAIEVVKGHVAGYQCFKCGADFDAEVFHDWDNNKHYWMAKLKNPEFWKLNNKTFHEGIMI